MSSQHNISSAQDDLALELTSQINFNNNLLQQLHNMEQSHQALQQKLSQKDQQLRECKVENEHLRSDYEELKEEYFSLEMRLEEQAHIAQQSEEVLLNEKDFRQRLERERDEYRAKYDVVADEYDQLKMQYDKLRDENQSLMERMHEFERDYTDLENEYNHTKQNNQREQARMDELLSHNEWLKEQHQKDHDAWKQKFDTLQMSFDKLQQQYKVDMSHGEETIFNLQSQLQKTDSHLQGVQRDATREIQQLKTQLQKEGNYFEQYYTSLTDIKHEVSQWASIAQNLQAKLNDAEQKNQSNINSLQLILQKDNVHLDHLYQEIMDVVKQKDQLTQTNSELEQTLQQMELNLEEEKSKSIMLQEKTSKLASRERELQRNFENLERRTREQHHVELEKVETELRNTKDRFLELQRDHKELQQRTHTLEMQNQTIGERERKYNDKLKITTESMRQLQAQLEKTKDLLKTTQDERLRLTKECESLTYELHQSLQRKTTSPRRRSLLQSPRLNPREATPNVSFADRLTTMKQNSTVGTSSSGVMHSPLMNGSSSPPPQRSVTPLRDTSNSTYFQERESSPVAKLGNGRMRRFGQSTSITEQEVTKARPPGAITGFPFSKFAQRRGEPDIQHANRTLETKFRNLQNLNQKLKGRDE